MKRYMPTLPHGLKWLWNLTPLLPGLSVLLLSGRYSCKGVLDMTEEKFEVSATAFYKVAMDKNKTKEAKENEAFLALCRMFEHNSFIKVLDIKPTAVDAQQKFFDYATVEMDLRARTVAVNYDRAYENTEETIKAEETPVGVALAKIECYDYETMEAPGFLPFFAD